MEQNDAAECQSPLKYPQHRLKGTAVVFGDIIESPLPAEAWDAVRGRLVSDDDWKPDSSGAGS
jgi:hypothetical protein